MGLEDEHRKKRNKRSREKRKWLRNALKGCFPSRREMKKTCSVNVMERKGKMNLMGKTKRKDECEDDENNEQMNTTTLSDRENEEKQDGMIEKQQKKISECKYRKNEIREKTKRKEKKMTSNLRKTKGSTEMGKDKKKKQRSQETGIDKPGTTM